MTTLDSLPLLLAASRLEAGYEALIKIVRRLISEAPTASERKRVTLELRNRFGWCDGPSREAWEPQALISMAAATGNLAQLKLLFILAYPWNESFLVKAIETGHVPLVEWALAQGLKPERDATELAVERGNPAVLQLLLDYGAKFDLVSAAGEAATAGHFEAVKWLHQHGCHLGFAVTSGAAASNHFEMLRWARSLGCDWDAMTTECAAQVGNLEMLKWAFGGGCPLGWEVAAIARYEGFLDILEWALAQGCSPDSAPRLGARAQAEESESDSGEDYGGGAADLEVWD